MKDAPRSPRKKTGNVSGGTGGTPGVGAPRAASRLSLAAILLGVMSLPAGLLPLVGILVAMVAIAVAIIALIRANRNGTARNYPIIGLVLSILAMGLALITTSVARDFPEHCQGLEGEELTSCVQEYRESEQN